MSVSELKEALDAYADHLPVRVGLSGEVYKIDAALRVDAANVLAVEYFEGAGSDAEPYVLIQVGQ